MACDVPGSETRPSLWQRGGICAREIVIGGFRRRNPFYLVSYLNRSFVFAEKAENYISDRILVNVCRFKAPALVGIGSPINWQSKKQLSFFGRAVFLCGNDSGAAQLFRCPCYNKENF